MILHQVEALAAAGVTDIVLAVNYRPEVMINVLKKVRQAWLKRSGGPITNVLTVRGPIQYQNRIFSRDRAFRNSRTS
jgi:mannose-1-phosphate guanylyltransferase